ncbi:MAG: hypothetical protein K2F93_10220, partial [Muribaculaceae bacterium]|nr:hypothetical protein [Muribaculaceae bacterium]
KSVVKPSLRYLNSLVMIGQFRLIKINGFNSYIGSMIKLHSSPPVLRQYIATLSTASSKSSVDNTVILLKE